MTAAALMYFSDRVTIASDTAVIDDLGATVGHAGKVYGIPTLRAVFFGRGKLSITSTIVTKLLLSPQFHTFDDALGEFSDLYRSVTDEWCEAVGFDRTGQHLHECCFAGWSDAQQRMRLCFSSSITDFALNYPEGFGGPVAWPRVPATFIPPAKSTDTADSRLAGVLRGIDDWCAANPKDASDLRLGGDMRLVDLTENSIAHRVIGTFEDSPAKPRNGAAAKRVAQRKAERAARKRRTH